MLEELAIAALGYVVLDKLSKDMDKTLRRHREFHEQLNSGKFQKDLERRIAKQQDIF